MNVIKRIKLSRLVGILFWCAFYSISGCFAAASIFLLPNGERISTELDSIDIVFSSNNGWLLGGYKVEKNGNNLAFVSFIPSNGDPAAYWPLDEGYASQFFKHKNEFYVMSSAGKVMEINASGLSATDFVVKPKSILIMDEPDLIACNPRGWAKLSAMNIGSCYRLDGAWDIKLSWTDIGFPPQICNGDLNVLVTTNKNRQLEIFVIDSETGELLSTRKIDKPEKNQSICEL